MKILFKQLCDLYTSHSWLYAANQQCFIFPQKIKKVYTLKHLKNCNLFKKTLLTELRSFFKDILISQDENNIKKHATNNYCFSKNKCKLNYLLNRVRNLRKKCHNNYISTLNPM